MSAPSRGQRSERPKNPLTIDAKARAGSRIALVLFLVLLAGWMAWDFMTPLGWATIIALAAWPAYRRFAELFPRTRREGLAPLLFTLLVGVVVLVPVTLATHRASQEGQAIVQVLTHYRQNGIPVPDWLRDVPAFGEPVSRWWQANLSDATAVVEWIGAADTKNDAVVTRAIGAEVLHRLVLFVVTLMALFGLLRHGGWIANRVLETADRVLGDPGERLASKVVDAIRGTVNGTIAVAVAEGALIGVAYWMAGVPHPLLFTILTIAFAMLPLGAWAMFSAASLLLVLEGGSPFNAAAVFGFGALVMLIGDAFVWPALVGNAARLPFLAALIGIFGGLQAFGLIGLFLGPVIVTALLTIWREWLLPREGRNP